MALNKEIMLPSDLSTVTPGVGIKGYNYAIVRNFMYVFGGGTSEYGVSNNQKIYKEITQTLNYAKGALKAFR